VEYTLEKIKLRGKKHSIEYNGDKEEVYYYVMKDGSGYLWYFENNTNYVGDQHAKTFEGTFHFKLENLEIDDDASRFKSEWKVVLKSGESSYMKLLMKDLTKPWGYKYSYIFEMRDEIGSHEQLIDRIKQTGMK